MEVKRSSNIELLRIVAMLMIIFHHFNVHGIFNNCTMNNSIFLNINNFFSAFFAIGGQLGVQLFLLITGYFMINSAPKILGFLKLYTETWCYSILFLIIAYIYGSHHVSSHLLNTSIFPICGCAYWFITYYLILYAIIPLLNIVIKQTNENPQIYSKFWAIVMFFTIGIPTFFHTELNFSPLIYFMIFYSLGAFIRLGTFKSLIDKKRVNCCAIISLGVIIINIILQLLKPEVHFYAAIRFSYLYSLFTICLAISVFNWFKNINIPYNKLINGISSSVFAVYLIHDNNFVRPFLWERLLNVSSWINSEFYIIKMWLTVITIFIICVLFDKIFSRIYSKLSNFIWERIK